MPIGVSLLAGRFRDGHLLRIGKVISDVLMAESDLQGQTLYYPIHGWLLGDQDVDF
jgi:hypothetical protein